MTRILLGNIADVPPPGRSRTFVANGKKILVANVGGELKAYENICPHMGGAMRYGGDTITCSWHGAQFDPKTGDGVANIDEGAKLKTMTVIIENGALYWEVPQERSLWADDF